ncbi:unnamed protein product [Bemisia tabaci]|uniref:Carbohydrate sulfotransferase n=1 Tax=Bemisia tabaci TaxID=7038 RepID=A0A9P0AKH8_BEMTA|nr:PREDICTED: carbohydrate sulfotransferase 11 [Bemisia tabaci]CAH0394765.1 unnamed protein product [Bemisia tabaci]
MAAFTTFLKFVLLSLIFLSTSSFYYIDRIQNLIRSRQGDLEEEPLNSWLLARYVYFERQEHLNNMCRLHSSHYAHTNMREDTQLLEHILVDRKHKLLYCYVPKVACTNWKRVLMVLSGLSNSSDASAIPADVAHKPGTITRLSDLDPEEAQLLLDTYTKFIFVRHPFERLLSAYRNKLEQHWLSSKYFQSRFGRHIVKHYRPNPTNHSLLWGDDVTFQEFVTFLIARENMTANEHWLPIEDLCRPCYINYDFIGKYETLYEDAEYLLKHIGEPLLKFPRGPGSNTSSQLNKYYTTLTSDMIKQLYDIFQMDFKMFAYNLQDFLGYEVG